MLVDLSHSNTIPAAHHDYKDLVKCLQDDLDMAQKKLKIAEDEISQLRTVIKGLETKLSAVHAKNDTPVSGASANTPEESAVLQYGIKVLCLSNEKDASEQDALHKVMDADAWKSVNSISPVHYKAKWYCPTGQSILTGTDASTWSTQIGWVLQAAALKQMPGLRTLNGNMLVGKCMRRLDDKAKDRNGSDIPGFFVLSDFVYALLFDHLKQANQWIRCTKNVNNLIAPSLTYFQGHTSSAVLLVVSYIDALRITSRHEKMRAIFVDAGDVCLQTVINDNQVGLNVMPTVVHHSKNGDGEHVETMSINGAKKRVIEHVAGIITECEEISTSEYKKKKHDLECSCGKPKDNCHLHGGSALCIVCKYMCFDPEHDKHCIGCFVYKFPTDPRSSFRTVRPEHTVRAAINVTFQGFTHNKVMLTVDKFHRRRIDHRILIKNTILAIETDEKAHQYYDKNGEAVRYHDFITTFKHKFVFIRFNPHSNMESDSAKTDFQHKLRTLLRTISTQMDRIRKGQNTAKLQTLKLFY